ncbi:aspartate aminotransferase family protein [Deferribacterales bacterium Es71-Z0220]|uniref:aspartate aminotransferase family protein n=1 Tax=Deferrivibrio essentukiensis TaxID=2880922 RepID=UPI001F60D22A|nr:aspartate aminotransferase family protein [Deferrivibrio essentukiensis]MCB4203419.1 aspartate aminotransferase family protein [Deferrivibrio essentukiensis]
MDSLIKCYKRYDISFIKGEGAYLFDKDGKSYIDFGSGISVTNLGHSFEPVVKAICEQAKSLIHTSNLYGIDIQEEVADIISENSFGGSVFFCNSGAEANEAAIKLARIYGNKKYNGLRYKIISLKNSFHGRTYATLSATGQDKVKDGFRPVADYFFHIDTNDFDAFLSLAKKNNVVAVMIELVQGEGGVVPLERGFVKALYDYAKNNDILLIVDEIQTGMGRTGELFAYKHYGIEPDIMTMAKALGNGVPIGAMVARKEVGEYLSYGTHGSTFGGNFLACAAAKSVLKEMLKPGFLKSVKEKGDYIKERLVKIFSNVGDVRGIGMMLGVKLCEDIDAAEFVKKALVSGLVIIPAGNNTFRVYPPLNIDYDTLDKGLQIFEQLLTK